MENLTQRRCGLTQLARAVPKEDCAIKFFVDLKLIQLGKRRCDCGCPCIKQKHESSKLHFRWVCTNRISCGKIIGPFQGTLFENSKITFLQVFDLVTHWFFHQKIRLSMADCEVSEHTAVYWFRRFRMVTHNILARSKNKIGGPGLFVEVDEAHLFRRKYNRGHRIKGESVWILGGVCRETKEKFVLRIEKRSRKCIWKALRRYVAPGSILVTDGFIVYQGVDIALGFLAHEVVIHKKHYVNPIFREIFTNTVECMWGKLKNVVRNSGSNESVDHYISEFVYRSKLHSMYGLHSYGEQLKHYLRDVAKVYKRN